MARGDVPLQQRAGANNAARPAPFGISEAKFDSRLVRVRETPFTLIARGLKEDPVCLAFALPLVFGYLINRTPGVINIEIYVVDAAGRRLLSTSGPVPSGADVGFLTNFLGVISSWILAPGEKMELVITSGDPNAGAGLWWWPQKGFIDGRVETPRIVMPASTDVVVVEPPAGRALYPSSFPFDNTFRCCFLFNYSPTTATTADVTIETEEGDLLVEQALPVPANAATAILTAFGAGFGLSYPNKVRVSLPSVPTDGDVVFEASLLYMDEPKAP